MLGTDALTGVALGNLAGNLTGFTLIYGMLSAMETLAPQAFGAGRFEEVGLLAQVREKGERGERGEGGERGERGEVRGERGEKGEVRGEGGRRGERKGAREAAPSPTVCTISVSSTF